MNLKDYFVRAKSGRLTAIQNGNRIQDIIYQKNERKGEKDGSKRSF